MIDAVPLQISRTYLSHVDELLPGLIDGLYLEGSAALGDFHFGASDVDFVALCSRKPNTDELLSLRKVHHLVSEDYKRPFFDGIYVTRDELTKDPARLTTIPVCHDHTFYPEAPDGWLNPITWHILATHGVSVRGPRLGELHIWQDKSALIDWCRKNIDTYWLAKLERAKQPLTKASFELLSDWGIAWTVLGLPRLHYTISTGDVVSKTEAGQYALRVFPEQYHQLINEALRIRSQHKSASLYSSRLQRRRDALNFAEFIIKDLKVNSKN